MSSPMGSPRKPLGGYQSFDIGGNDSFVNEVPRTQMTTRMASEREMKSDSAKQARNRAGFRPAPEKYDHGAGISTGDVRAKEKRTVVKMMPQRPTSLLGGPPDAEPEHPKVRSKKSVSGPAPSTEIEHHGGKRTVQGAFVSGDILTHHADTGNPHIRHGKRPTAAPVSRDPLPPPVDASYRVEAPFFTG